MRDRSSCPALAGLIVACALVVGPAAGPVAGQDASGEEAQDRLLATIPEGLTLERPPLAIPGGGSMENSHVVVWGPGGVGVAYVADRGKETVPVIGEEVHDAYDFLDRPLYSDDGAHVLFRAGNSKGKRKEVWWLLVDGERQFQDDWLGSPCFSPDGTSIGFWSNPGAKLEGEFGTYVGGSHVLCRATAKGRGWKVKKGKKWENSMALLALEFTGDGEHLVTGAMRGGEWFVLTASGSKETPGKEGYPFFLDVVAGPTSDSFALVSMEAGPAPASGDLPPGFGAAGFGRTVVSFRGERLGTDFLGASSPAISPDGARCAFVATVEDGAAVAIDDVRLEGTWTSVEGLVWSSDGGHLAFVANEGGTMPPGYGGPGPISGAASMLQGGTERVVVRSTVDRTRDREYPAFLEVLPPVFSVDGAHVAYAARSVDGWHAVVDDDPGPAFDEVGRVGFEPDAGRVSFGARTGRELWWRSRALPSLEGDGG